MCSAPQVALIPGLPWPWSWAVVLGAAVPVAIGAFAVAVLVSKLTSRRDRRRFLTLVWQWTGCGRR
jgi:hypothetical protein